MSTIAVILVNVDELDEYIGTMSDEEFDKKTEEYIRDEVERGNFQDSKIRYATTEGKTQVCVSNKLGMWWCDIEDGNITDVDGIDDSQYLKLLDEDE